MKHVVYLNRLSFTPTDEQGVPLGDAVIVGRGEPVPDFVRPFEISALTHAGMIVPVADDAVLPRTPGEQMRPMPNPEQPTTPDGLPPLLSLDATTAAPVDADPFQVVDGEPQRVPALEDTSPPQLAVTEAPVEKPKASDSKDTWEAYAVSRGIPRGEAESMTKRDLVAAVEARESA